MVASWKEEEVKTLGKKIKTSKVVGLVGINGIPSRSFVQMRKSLRGKVDLRVTRNRLIRRALKKGESTDLEPFIKGEMGIILTDSLNPFQLERLLSQSRTAAPAKPGSIAPLDIVIPAGNTPFAAGPIIGELQAAGVKAKIESGKIVVSEDSKIVSAGEAISLEVASVLNRFGIEPFEIGLDLYVAKEEGTVYSSEILKIDEEQTLKNFTLAHQQALNLAFQAEIFTSETVLSFVQKAHWAALNLAIGAEIPTKETIESLLLKAGLEAQALAGIIPKNEKKTGDKKVEQEKETIQEDVKEAPTDEAPGTDKKEKEPEPEVKEETKIEKQENEPEEEKPAEIPVKDEPEKTTAETTVEKPVDEPAKEEKADSSEKKDEDSPKE